MASLKRALYGSITCVIWCRTRGLLACRTACGGGDESDSERQAQWALSVCLSQRCADSLAYAQEQPDRRIVAASLAAHPSVNPILCHHGTYASTCVDHPLTAHQGLSVMRHLESPACHLHVLWVKAQRVEMTQGLGDIAQRPVCGSNTPVMKWIHYGDHAVDPLLRSQTGSYMPVTNWILYAGHRMDPMWRSVTACNFCVI